MSTSGKGLAKLMALIEPWPGGRGSSFVEKLDELLGGDQPKRRVDQFRYLVPIDLHRGREVQPEPARRTQVGGEEEPTILLEGPTVALVHLDHDRVRVLAVVGALHLGFDAAAVH